MPRYCEECDQRANYGLVNQRPTHCNIHKLTGMIDVKHRKCIHGRQKCWDCSPLELLQHVCRKRIRDFFRGYSDPEKLLGTSNYQIIYDHIKLQMTPNMTCLNYGNRRFQWSLDHIISIMFNNPTNEEIEQRFHYSNLQPMFGNSKKQNMVRLEDIQTLANHWDTLTPQLQNQVYQIRNRSDTLLYDALSKREKKQKIKLILKSKPNL
jgi:hypothetical protein